MTDAILDGESVLDFVTSHYDRLKREAETGPSNASITAVIDRINTLYKTITTKGDDTHDEIVKQLKELKTQYNGLGPLLGDDIVSYTRYIDANTSLIMIVDGFNEVEEEGKGEELAPGAGSPASAPALVPASESALVLASRALGPASNALVPASESASGTASGTALVLASRAPASIASTASESKA